MMLTYFILDNFEKLKHLQTQQGKIDSFILGFKTTKRTLQGRKNAIVKYVKIFQFPKLKAKQ